MSTDTALTSANQALLDSITTAARDSLKNSRPTLDPAPADDDAAKLDAAMTTGEARMAAAIGAALVPLLTTWQSLLPAGNTSAT